MKLKLTIELIPQSAWKDNLRNYVGATRWNKIRKEIYKRADYKCEICSGQGKKHPVECHEKWKFEEGKIILLGLIALCPSCHEVKHIGRAQATGNLERAIKHFREVNKVSNEVARKYISECFRVYHQRSEQKWELDLECLKKFI